MFRKTILVTLLTIFCINCGEALDTPESIQQQSAIFGTNRYYLSSASQRRELIFARAAALGRSVATIVDATNVQSACSATLINDNILISADHCFDSDSIGIQIRARFGSWEDSTNFVRQRLRQLGLYNLTVGSNGRLLSDNTIISRYMRWNCTLLNNRFRGPRDIRIMSCQSKTFSGIQLKPGNIFGHMTLSEAGPSDRQLHDPILAIAWDNWSPPTDRVFVAPAIVTSTDTNCYRGYSHCIGENSDTTGGSSGGAMINVDDYKIVAIRSAKGFGTGIASKIHASDVSTHNIEQNILHNPRRFNGQTLTSKLTTYVGGSSGGQTKMLLCPTDFAAIGVIGTDSQHQGYVGNFGLICAPEFANDTSGLARQHQTQHWKVIVGGSFETEHQHATFDFIDYLAIHLDRDRANDTFASFTNQLQTFHVCTPGNYLTGIEATSTPSAIGQIRGIRCQRLDMSDQSSSRVPQRIQPTIGASTGILNDIKCEPYPDGRPRAAIGLALNSWWYTNGFSIVCR